MKLVKPKIFNIEVQTKPLSPVTGRKQPERPLNVHVFVEGQRYLLNMLYYTTISFLPWLEDNKRKIEVPNNQYLKTPTKFYNVKQTKMTW